MGVCRAAAFGVMKKALMAIVALLLLGGGAAGAYFYFGKQAEAAVTSGEEGHDAEKAETEKKEAGGHGESHGAVFVEMDPLILPVIDETGVSQNVSFVVVIEVSDEEKAKQVEALTPRLKDAFIQNMYGVLNKREALRGGVVQVGMVKERLNEVSQRVMGEGVVDGVLLQVVQQRPM